MLISLHLVCNEIVDCRAVCSCGCLNIELRIVCMLAANIVFFSVFSGSTVGCALIDYTSLKPALACDGRYAALRLEQAAE